MEMHQVRYFLAVARTLNFTRAAEECNVAQPSLTRAIKNLEEELGGELFRRERASSHLTNLGREMVPLLGRCYDSAIAAKSQAQSFKTGEYSPLRIVLSHTVDLDLMADALRELERAFANVKISCDRAPSDEVIERLRTGGAELALAGPIDSGWSRLETWPLFEEAYRVVVREDHPFAKRKSVAPGDLAHERLIARPYCEQWSVSETLYKEEGIDLQQCWEVTSDRDAIRMIEAGMGIGLLPASARIGEDMRRIHISLPAERALRIYTVAGRQRSPALTALINLLRSADWTKFEREAAAA